MFQARQDQQLVVHVKNEIGALAKLSKLIADHGINLLALDAAGRDGQGEIYLFTDDNLRAGDALKAQGYDTQTQHAILLDAEHKPGLLRRITETLAREGINIHKVYASALTSQDRCLVVMHTEDDERAMVMLSD